MDEKTLKDLRTRVEQFQMLQLPGQMQIMHMGTSYLVNDLWRAVQELAATPEDQRNG